MTDKPAQPDSDKPTMAQHGDVEEFRKLMQTYGMPILTGILVAAGGFLVMKAFQARRQGSIERAAQALAVAASPQAYQDVTAQYPNTPSAPIAQLGLAAEYYANAQYDEALAEYNAFEVRYPAHPMRIAVGACKAQCMEAVGQLDEALAAFAAFVEAHPDHYMATVALRGKARCLEQLGRYDEARTTYEDLIAADPDSEWAALSEKLLEDVQKTIRAEQTQAN